MCDYFEGFCGPCRSTLVHLGEQCGFMYTMEGSRSHMSCALVLFPAYGTRVRLGSAETSTATLYLRPFLLILSRVVNLVSVDFGIPELYGAAMTRT